MMARADQKAAEVKYLDKRAKQFRFFDCDRNNKVNVHDLYAAISDFREGFIEFAFNKDVKAMVVGIMIGGGLQGLAKSVVTDILTPLLVSPWAGSNLAELFLIMKPSCRELNGVNTSNSATCGFSTMAEAQAANAATFNYGNFFDTLISFFFMALFVYAIYRAYNMAQLWVKLQTKEFQTWCEANTSRLNGLKEGEPEHEMEYTESSPEGTESSPERTVLSEWKRNNQRRLSITVETSNMNKKRAGDGTQAVEAKPEVDPD